MQHLRKVESYFREFKQPILPDVVEVEYEEFDDVGLNIIKIWQPKLNSQGQITIIL